MALISNMSIKVKLFLAFAIVLTAGLGLGLFALNRLGAVNDKASMIRDDYLASVRYLGEVSTQTERFRLKRSYILIAPTPELQAKFESEVGAVLEARDQAWKAYLPSVDAGSPEEGLAANIQRDWDAYMAQVAKITELLRAGHKDQAIDFFLNGEAQTTFDAVKVDIAKDLDYNIGGGDRTAAEGTAIYASAKLWIFVVLALAIGLSVASGLMLVVTVSTPIRRMTNAMNRLAGHDLTTEIAGLGQKDEIGEMAAAVEIFKTGLIDADRLAAEQRAEQSKKEARIITVDGYIDGFDRSVRESLDTLASAATEMNATSATMAAIAQQTSHQSTIVSAAAEETSANVQTVASAAEEMSASISEITRQVTEAADVARNAVRESATTTATIRGLEASAQKIGDVVSLINSIASQTNLLALNATIEAARAGDAGKGFAVVAAEVKALANQTGRATEEISAQVGAIQNSAREAVKAIMAIDGTISRISEISSTIAAAVEEQTATTVEISRNTQEAAKGTEEVTRNIAEVNAAASQTGAAASQVLSASGELGQQAETLRGDVASFLAAIKAA